MSVIPLLGCVCSSHLQRAHGESAHVVPEDQSALWACGGDGRRLEVSGVAVSTVGTVRTHVPTLGAASVTAKTGIGQTSLVTPVKMRGNLRWILSVNLQIPRLIPRFRSPEDV